MHSNT